MKITKETLSLAEELGSILKDKYKDAYRCERTMSFYVFALEHEEKIRHAGVKFVIKAAGLKPSFITELSRAMKLTKYVKLK